MRNPLMGADIVKLPRATAEKKPVQREMARNFRLQIGFAHRKGEINKPEIQSPKKERLLKNR